MEATRACVEALALPDLLVKDKDWQLIRRNRLLLHNHFVPAGKTIKFMFLNRPGFAGGPNS